MFWNFFFQTVRVSVYIFNDCFLKKQQNIVVIQCQSCGKPDKR